MPDGQPMPVYQRGSCCLYYRSEELEGESEIDADFLARFGNDSPPYCGTCRLRAAADVEARAVYWALRARAAVRSVERPVELGARGMRAGEAAERRARLGRRRAARSAATSAVASGSRAQARISATEAGFGRRSSSGARFAIAAS